MGKGGGRNLPTNFEGTHMVGTTPSIGDREVTERRFKDTEGHRRIWILLAILAVVAMGWVWLS